MGRLFAVQLEGKTYSCKHCQIHLALCVDIVSKSFHCRHGKAYLFSKVVNVSLGPKEERMMTTGMHTVCDIFCVRCGSILGWKYEAAHETNQKYKEGKYILERQWFDQSPHQNIQIFDAFSRYKVSGPDGSNYWISHEPEFGGSDADDA